MGTTPNFSLPYPELSDAVDVSGDMTRLAARIDTVLGSAVSGTSHDHDGTYWKVWTGSRTEYNALPTPRDPQTLFVVTS